MAGEANAAEFEGGAYLRNWRAARGLDPSDRVTGGIFQPAPEKLRAHLTTIYRFGDTAKDLDRDRFGPWWITRETMELLVAHAGDAEALVMTARIHLAVPPEFSAMNRCFRAIVRQTLRAFGGVGGLVYQDPSEGAPEGSRPVIWPGGTELTGRPADRTSRRQLFIPGLASVPDALVFQPVRSVSEVVASFHSGTE